MKKKIFLTLVSIPRKFNTNRESEVILYGRRRIKRKNER
jgi:hypothetical protein